MLTLHCWDIPLEQFVEDHNSFQLRKYAFYIYTSTSIPFQYMMKIKENQTHAKILYLANIRHTANSKTSTKYRLQFCTSVCLCRTRLLYFSSVLCCWPGSDLIALQYLFERIRKSDRRPSPAVTSPAPRPAANPRLLRETVGLAEMILVDSPVIGWTHTHSTRPLL